MIFGWREGLALANAALTTASIGCAIVARRAIRAKRVAVHERFMIAAFVLAAIFMVTFVTRIVLYGVAAYDMKRSYFKIAFLLFAGTHDAVAVISVPLVLLSLILGLNRSPLHKQIAAVAYPVWLYSAFSGVILYVVLYVLQ